MSDYISRQAAIEAVDECTKLKITDDFYTVYTEEMKDVIADIPAADVVEVVRCKNCKHRHDSLLDGSPFEDFCDVFPAYIAKDDFCSYGERKEG